jgi:DNA repair exonuclease SbcCD ATPase subunit
MPPKKATNNENKPVKQEVIIEDVDDSSDSDDSDVSDDVSDEEEDEDEDEEAENEDEDEACDQVEKVNNTSKEAKEKVKKMTFNEICVEIDALTKQEQELDSEIKTHKEKQNALEKKRNAIKKSKNKLIGLLPKAHIDGCNIARKEKKKRTNSSKSGILNILPVPPILIKFLEIPENSLMERPKVFSLLNNKFKDLKLKHGQETILDEKTAKLFGLKEGHKIEFKQYQTFLAKIYTDAGIKSEKKISTEVVL